MRLHSFAAGLIILSQIGPTTLAQEDLQSPDCSNEKALRNSGTLGYCVRKPSIFWQAQREPCLLSNVLQLPRRVPFDDNLDRFVESFNLYTKLSSGTERGFVRSSLLPSSLSALSDQQSDERILPKDFRQAMSII